MLLFKLKKWISWLKRYKSNLIFLSQFLKNKLAQVTLVFQIKFLTLNKMSITALKKLLEALKQFQILKRKFRSIKRIKRI